MSGNFKNILFGEGNRLRGMKRYIAAAVTVVMGGTFGFFAVTGNADGNLSDVAYEDDTIVIETLPSLEETDDNVSVFSAKVATYTREAVTVGVDGNIRRADMVVEEEAAETAVDEADEVSEGSANVSEYSLASPEDDDEDGASSALDYEPEVEETISVVAVEPEMSAEAAETEEADAAETEAAETEAEAAETEADEDSIAAFDEEITDGVDPESIERVSKFDVPDWLELDENGVPVDYADAISGKSCAYTAEPDALMSTGKTVFQGYVAVDPDIIPYGSELYIIAEDGEVYGYAIAADTGYSVSVGDIIVDLFMDEYDDCIQWGAKNVTIYILR